MNKQELYLIADELHAMATLGLTHADDVYDITRYEKIIAASARMVATLENRSVESVQQEYMGNLNHVSPILGTDAVLIQEGKILLIQRADNGLWATPGGLTDVGETLSEGCLRELREETGLRGTAKRLLGIFDSRIWSDPLRFHLNHCVFEVSVTEEQTPILSNETIDVGFFDPENLPPLHHGHDLRLPIIFELLNGQRQAPYFD